MNESTRRWTTGFRFRAVLASAVALTVLVPVANAEAAQQITIFKWTGSQTAGSYWQPPVTQPSSYTSPNYAGGRATVKITVLDKPSSKPMQALVCFWRHGARKFQFETCKAVGQPIINEGTYVADLGSPQSWWKKGGTYDWSQRASVIRIMLKDPATGKLFLSQKCGSTCYRGADLGQHVPVRFSGELTMVAKG